MKRSGARWSRRSRTADRSLASRGVTTMLLSEGGGLAALPSSAKGMAVAIARASTMSAAEYDDLRRRAVERGGEFERGPSQYVAFRSVFLHDLEQRSYS